MNKKSVKICTLVLTLALIVMAFAGCGDSASSNIAENEQVSVSQNDTLSEQGDDNTSPEENANQYPNVEGYPIEKNGIKECKLFINGTVYEDCNGYTKDDHPEILYITVDPVLYKTYQHTCGLITSSNVNGGELKLSGKVINGKQVLCAIGVPCLLIDGEVYDDLSPELVEFVEGWEDYCCTTLFLEKTAGAKVHISEDRSAAYIEIDTPISTEDNDKYELSIENGGKFVATDKATGEAKSVEVPSAYTQQTQPQQAQSGEGSGTRTVCPGCGGSGTIAQQLLLYQDTITNTFKYTTIYNPCGRCGGKGYIEH